MNYTIFNSNRDSIEYQNSKIVMLQSAKQTYLDFNEHQVIECKTMGRTSYSEKDAADMLGSIKNTIDGKKQKRKR